MCEKQEVLLVFGQKKVIFVWKVRREYMQYIHNRIACKTSFPVLIVHSNYTVTYDLCRLVKLSAERLISMPDVTMGNVALLMHILNIGH